MATILERVATLEERQRSHESKNEESLALMTGKIAEVEETANLARDMVSQTNTLVAQMPSKIMEAIRAEKKGNRFEAKEWLTLAIGILLLVLAIPTSIQAYQSLNKTTVSVQASP